MAQTDIVARLELRAEQFSSEAGAAFAGLKQRAASSSAEIRNTFTSAFADVQKLAATSLNMPRTKAGALDLGPQIEQLRLQASAADQAAIAQRELSVAMTSAARAAGANADALRLEADAAAVASLASERHAQELRQQIQTYEAVQAELNKTISSTRQLTEAEQRANASAASHQQGMVQLGQQFNDFAVQVASGQSAAIAFAQQLPQAAYAISQMGGALGTVGRFLVGPWGTAITIALVVLTPFVAKLWETEEAAKAAEAGADGLADAQGVLGKMFNLTSGKIEHQNDLLRINARLTAANLRAEAVADRASAEKAFTNAGKLSWTEMAVGAVSEPFEPIGSGTWKGRRNAENLANIVKNVKGGSLKPEMAVRLAENMSFEGVNVEKSEFLSSLAKLVAAPLKEQAANEIDKSLDTGTLSPMFRREGHKRTRKSADLTPMANSAEEEIARINSEWDEQPKLIDKARIETLKLDHLIEELGRRKPPGFEKLISDAKAAQNAIDAGLIRQIGKAFEEPETLAQRGTRAISELNAEIASLEARKPPNWEALVRQAEATKQIVAAGMNRPMTEYVRQQRESLAVGQLVLQGRDAEAQALQDALRLQQQLGRSLRDDELATVLEIARTQERIQRALEDQRRIVGIYTSAVSNLSNTFAGFLDSMGSKRLEQSFGGLISGFAADIKSLGNNLIVNSVFGGVDRKVEDYVRQITGRRTPAEVLSDQARDAGTALAGATDKSASALDDFTRAVRAASDRLNATGIGEKPKLLGATAPTSGAMGLNGLADTASSLAAKGALSAEKRAEEIVVTGKRPSADRSADRMLRASDALGVAVDGLAENLERNLGIKVPKQITDSLKKSLPTVVQGIGAGSVGGSIFASISGRQADPLASSIGGILGEKGGKALGGVLSKAIGGTLGKTIGGLAGPLGGVLGGVLGNVVGGLFKSQKWSDATVTMNPYGTAVGSTATGNAGSAKQAATGTAASVATGINAVVDKLGAQIKALPAITLGMWDGKYRVADLATTKPLHSKNFGPDVLHDFGDNQQAAIEYAIRYSVSHAVLTGISQASQNILRSGQDLESALQKALMIEAIPRDLKAMLDPLGAAVDDLNRKWIKTVNALKEGGATAEQMAQAEQLYNLQLAQVRNTTESATQTLKDFRKSLQLGSSSPLSLRDQERTALTELSPFLAKIQAGQAVDQDKYREAAQAYLDVERQLYGSTERYFQAFDQIQAATNAAIAAIDNVKPISDPVANPFTQAAVDAAKRTADAVQTGNEMTQDTNALLAQAVELLARVADNDRSADTGFLGTARNFAVR